MLKVHALAMPQKSIDEGGALLYTTPVALDDDKQTPLDKVTQACDELVRPLLKKRKAQARRLCRARQQSARLSVAPLIDPSPPAPRSHRPAALRRR